MNINEWAAVWGVPQAAIDDLRNRLLGLDNGAPPAEPGRSEAAVQSRARVRYSQMGWRMWRNNVGAYHDEQAGIHLRFGLANDSPAVNKVLKSADLIGIKPRIIGPQDVGSLFGQFVSREVKREGWRFNPLDEHDQAQMAWANLVISLGGDAGFVSSDQHV